MKRSFSSRDDRLHACAPERTKRLGLTGARLAVGLGLAAVLASSAASLPSTSRPASEPRTFKTGAISMLAADGTWAAVRETGPLIDKAAKVRCYRIVAVNVAAKKNPLTRIKTGVCANEGRDNILGLAVAGKRVAWLQGLGGNDLEMSIAIVPLGVPKAKTTGVASAVNGGADEAEGSFLGGLVGKGDLLVFEHWTMCTAESFPFSDSIANCYQPSPREDQEAAVFKDQQLREVVGDGSAPIVGAPNRMSAAWDVGPGFSLPVVWVDGGRILVRNSEKLLTIYSKSGSILKQISAAPGTTFCLRPVLRGSQLLNYSGEDLDLYNVSSGNFSRGIPIGSGAKLRGFQNGLAVYLTGRQIHVLRLSNDKRFAFVPSKTGFVDARIEAAGLFYAFNPANRRNSGRIAFIPIATLLRKLRSM